MINDFVSKSILKDLYLRIDSKYRIIGIIQNRTKHWIFGLLVMVKQKVFKSVAVLVSTLMILSFTIKIIFSSDRFSN